MPLDVKLTSIPTHTGLLFPADEITGIGFTVTETVPDELVHPPADAVTV